MLMMSLRRRMPRVLTERARRSAEAQDADRRQSAQSPALSVRVRVVETASLKIAWSTSIGHPPPFFGVGVLYHLRSPAPPQALARTHTHTNRT